MCECGCADVVGDTVRRTGPDSVLVVDRNFGCDGCNYRDIGVIVYMFNDAGAKDFHVEPEEGAALTPDDYGGDKVWIPIVSEKRLVDAAREIIEEERGIVGFEYKRHAKAFIEMLEVYGFRLLQEAARMTTADDRDAAKKAKAKEAEG